MSDVRSRPLLTIFILSMVSVSAKVLGFVRDQIMASKFGVSALTDAYVSAQVVPTVFDTIVGTAIASVIVPLFVRAQNKKNGELSTLATSAFTVFALLFIAESLITLISGPQVMRLLIGNTSLQDLSLAVRLAYIFAPSVALTGISALLSAFLTTRNEFLIPGVATLLPNLFIVIFALISWSSVTPEWLAIATVVGLATQTIVLVARTFRSGTKLIPIKVDFGAIKDIVSLSLPLMMANSVGQVSSVADKLFASRMPEGTMSALSYASKLLLLPVSAVVVGVSPVVYSRFSKLSAAGDEAGLAEEIGRSLQGLFFVFAPLTLLLAVFAEPAVSIIYQRGQFDHAAVLKTSSALSYYSIGLFPLAAQPILTRALYALRDTRTQLYATLANTLCYLVTAVLIGPPWAHRGLALAFAFAQLGFAGVASSALRRRVGNRPFLMLARTVPATCLASFSAVGIAWAVSLLISSVVVKLLCACLVTALFYLGLHLILRTEAANWVKYAISKIGHGIATKAGH